MEEAVEILSQVSEYVDIAEVGTLGMYCGLSAVREIKERFPNLEVLADLKIPDGGEECAQAAFLAGADYVTVMGVADNITIQGAVRAAQKHGKKVVADMITTKNIAERLKEVDNLGVDYIAVHIACDVQSEENTPFEQLNIARLVLKNAKLSVAGGINRHNASQVIAARPDIVVSGLGICGQPDRQAAAKSIKEQILQMK